MHYNSHAMPHHYPILLDLRDAKIVIVGGGKVAARKAAGLIEAGAADITVIAPEIAGVFASSVRQIKQSYAPEILTDATLVFAATDRAEVNAKVVRDARSKGILVNRADADADPTGDFITPAKLVVGDITLTVSAGSAALSVMIRDGLRDRLDPRWVKLAEVMRTLRPWLRDEVGLTPVQRAAAFRMLATPEALDRATDGVDALRTWILSSIR